MNYSKETTFSHPLSKKYNQHALILLNELLKKEGAKKDFFNEEIVLNLDEVEKKLKTNCGDKCETMDFCMGLSSNQMLLTELKLKVFKPQNLEKKKLENKIRYSKCLLGEEIPVLKDKVFLFNDQVIEIARRILARLFNNNPNLKVYTVNEFKDIYFRDKSSTERAHIQ